MLIHAAISGQINVCSFRIQTAITIILNMQISWQSAQKQMWHEHTYHNTNDQKILHKNITESHGRCSNIFNIFRSQSSDPFIVSYFFNNMGNESGNAGNYKYTISYARVKAHITKNCRNRAINIQWKFFG